jgi:SNF2 family DNA or RNA helicase
MYNYKTEPFKHQRFALTQGAKEKNFAYFMEMGTGKTKVAIDNACFLFQQNLIQFVIVIAPNSVYQNWQKEISVHSPETYNIWTWKVDPEKKLLLNDSKLTFILMNVEALSHKSGVKFLDKLLQVIGLRSMMIVDESTTIKNRTARRTKAILKLSQYVKYKRILTGSPVTKSPLDLFTQCAFLDWKLLGYESFFTYRSRYAVMHTMEMNGRQVMFPKYYTNLDELEARLKMFSYRCRKKDCLDLPDKLYSQRYIDLTEEQKKVYVDLKKKALAVVKDETISYANKLTEVLRLHQVVNGFVKTDEGNIKAFKTNPKLKELMSILEETEDKCIIWANYVFNINEIKKAIGETYGKDSVVSIFGEDSVEVRKDAVENFQSNDRCRFLVGNPTVGGYGLTLTAARYVIYFSNSYNLEVRQQSEDRAHRIGQGVAVTYIDLIANKSIDEMIIGSLEGKIEISAKTLGEEVQKWL